MNLTRRDWMVGAIAGIHIATHFITNMAMWSLRTCAGTAATIEATTQAFERNPAVFLAVKELNFLAITASYMYIPASIIAAYVIMRRFLKGEKEMYLDFFVMMLLFSMIANFSNDLGAYLGMLM